MRAVTSFRPPGQVLGIFLAVAAVSAVALGGLAWQLLEQDGNLEAQRQQVQLEQTADSIVAAMQQALADLQAHVGTGQPPARTLPPDVVAISITPNGVASSPPGRLPYHPASVLGREVSPLVFAEGERLEFTTADTVSAIATYRRLALDRDPAVRGGALMRLARVYRKRGASEPALRAYAALGELGPVVVEELPAGLLAYLGRLSVLEETARLAELRAEAARLIEDLHAARWPLTRTQYETYVTFARQRLRTAAGDDRDAITRSEAAAWLWERRDAESPLARRVLALPSGTALVVWRSTPASLDGLIAGRSYLAALAGQVLDGPAHWAISDLEGRRILGEAPPTGPAAVRTAVTSGLPWTLHVFAPAGQALPPSPRRLLLLLVLGLVTVVLAAGWYFIYRSLSREREVARLQSDFVAAVSHEFRSPLTALSHAADLLAHDKLTSEASRRQMYDVLVRDTSRLRSLVEGLLEFGRLEAGATAFRFESLDVGALVASTVAEFQDRVAADGYTIELAGHLRDVCVSADREALARAIWNVLDNAVKYSPESRTVRVDVAREAGRVCIAVCDHGIGIPADEQRTIFDRFVRGSESKSRRIHGTGIGLAMVRQIVRAHGGDVDVESKEGQGSIFTIRLPLGQARPIEADPLRASVASAGERQGG